MPGRAIEKLVMNNCSETTMIENRFANVGDNTWVNLAHVAKVTLKPEYLDDRENRVMRRTTTISIYGVDGALLHSICTTVSTGEGTDPESVARDNAYHRRICKSLGLCELPHDDESAGA